MDFSNPDQNLEAARQRAANGFAVDIERERKRNT